MAAIPPHHDPIEGKSVAKHDLIVRFLRGARKLNLPRPSSLPSWDLVLVLRALQTAPLEPLQSVELKFLSLKSLLQPWSTGSTPALPQLTCVDHVNRVTPMQLYLYINLYFL